MAVRILQGAAPESISVASRSNIPVFDHAALERWRIDPRMLPANATIINRPPPSLYERYTVLVWSVIAAFVVLLTLVVGLAGNIVSRHRVEHALRQSEERFRTLIELSPIPIILGREERCLYANRALARLVGSPAPETLIGRRLLDFVAPEERDKIADHISRRKSDEGFPSHYESVGLRLDGSRFPYEVNVAIIDLPDGSCSLAFVHDITERRQAEEEREKLQAQLLQAQKMESVGRLAGGVAHDFNNMLAVILGYSELALKKTDPTQPIYANLLQIHKAAEHSVDLTRQLLAFARKQTVAPKVLDLNGTVEGMLKMLHRLIGEDINLAWRPGKNLWPVRVDPSQIDQILVNLCVNGRDAISGPGKIIIETGNVTLDETYCALQAGVVSGDYVLLAVSDDGCGIAEETMNKLFDPFFTTKEMGKGTGLGLATVYGIVRQNNGYINVYSEPDQGTTFKIYLPRHAAEVAPIPKDEDTGKPTAHGRETILLVEDEPMILNMATTMLELQGYKVLAAATPREAIRLAMEYTGEIHLLVTDVIMPEMNGRDLAEKLLSHYPNLKRLFMSGYTANVIAHHGVLDEGIHFIQKPFSMKDLCTKVRETLDTGDTGDHT